MTYNQLAEAIARLEEWEAEIAAIRSRNYDPHGHDAERLADIEHLKAQEIS